MTFQNPIRTPRDRDGSRDGFVTRTLDGVRDLLSLAAVKPDRYPFLLESTARGTPQGRNDLLFAFPGETLGLSGTGELQLSGKGCDETDFLKYLDKWWSANRQPYRSQSPVFCGGWFLMLGYELATQIEPTLNLTMPETMPVAEATRVPAGIIVDHVANQTVLVAESGYAELLDAMLEDLAHSADTYLSADDGSLLEKGLMEEPPEHYLDAVRKAKNHIAAGDVFQANLSRAWTGTLRDGVNPVCVYSRLRAANPAPFAGLSRFGTGYAICSSPERLVRIRQQNVETRPIAGTRPRGGGRASDTALSNELIGHPKERAEHIMLIDLERNDLGRICRPGSVQVDEMMALESYAHVHHIVSNVSGTLEEGVLPGQTIRAVFPGGTITGCPKVRCMEIISELEAGPRGPYTGAMGFLNRDGSCDLNILIRTLTVNGRCVELRAGAGIVADSEPRPELNETRAKAKGMILALEGNEQS